VGNCKLQFRFSVYLPAFSISRRSLRSNFRIQNRILPVPVFNQITIIRETPWFSSKMHFNIIFSCMFPCKAWCCYCTFLLPIPHTNIVLFPYMQFAPSVWSPSICSPQHTGLFDDLTVRLYTAALQDGLCSNTLGLSSSPRNCCARARVWVCVSEWVSVCVWVRERERERESVCVCNLWNWWTEFGDFAVGSLRRNRCK
jgi:hypothetical protein